MAVPLLCPIASLQMPEGLGGPASPGVSEFRVDRKREAKLSFASLKFSIDEIHFPFRAVTMDGIDRRHNNFAHNCAVLAVACVFIVCSLQGDSVNGNDRVAANASVPPEVETSVLVLHSGRVVSGIINQAATGYVIKKPQGQLVVPFDKVLFEAADLHDAYRKLRLTIPAPTAKHHISLARWCMSRELLKEARKELFDALVLEPSNESARRMLASVQESIRPGSTQTEALPSAVKRTDEGFQAPDARSLSGLDPKAAQQFVRTVQPILMNKCSNASCHGADVKNDFRLIRIRRGRGSHRVYVERNLATTLKFVDLKQPDKSPLLTKPQSSHGRTGRAIFFGSYAESQITALRDWSRMVAGVEPSAADLVLAEKTKSVVKRDRKSDATTLFVPTSSKTPRHVESSLPPRAATLKSNEPTDRPVKSKDSLPSINQKVDTTVSPDRVRELVKRPRRDAFDPEEFNRETSVQR